MTDYRQTLHVSVIAPFASLLDSAHLSDCEVRIFGPGPPSDAAVFRGHRVVLANSCEFFANLFLTDCLEFRTGVVELRATPAGPMLAILRWMYTGSLECAFDDFMPHLRLSRHLGVRGLEAELAAALEAIASPATVLRLCNQCYERGLGQERELLQTLQPFLLRFLDAIPMAELTSALDVATFAGVLERSGLPNERRIAMIVAFLGDYAVQREDQAALERCLVRDATLRPLLAGKNYTWLRSDWVRSLK
jgi:hypothetical protein